jgi:hypothetical protein
VGEGGTDARCAFVTGEGSVSADRDPSSDADFVRATFYHKGRREEAQRQGAAPQLCMSP